MGNESQCAAAVDLGSNSFHMIVAEVDESRLKVIDKMREMVRLAGGLDEKNRLSEEVMQRAVECLRRFGQRLRAVPSGRVRAVGTNTLRKARNSAQFIGRAEDALGHAIDIIAGHEEARLIYLGVSHSLEDDSRRRLVVDIGGGSTEIILGRKFEPRRMESLHMGCVGSSLRFFPDGRITAERMRAAEIAALQELEPIATVYREIGWETSIGASGTVLAIAEAVHDAGWCKDGISAAALKKLSKALVAAGNAADVKMAGVTAERAPVFPGGVAILTAVFEALEIEQMSCASGALREGLIYDLAGRLQQDDIRERTVADLADRYRIDATQADGVKRKAVALWEMVREEWQLDTEEYQRLLGWAACLHEIGLSISHSQYHKHSAYLLNNLDMPGFSRGEQQRMAFLVRAHRRKFPLTELQALPDDDVQPVRRLCVLLRLAVLLHRARANAEMPRIEVEVDGETLKLRFPEDWLQTHPLTAADLELEGDYLKAAGFRLKSR
ncbi:MAG: Exopolyphosphatase [Gammaproteobacteria bacterium]|nr:Exopolyphosphatase [Gammaproteobacteria bacterium]